MAKVSVVIPVYNVEKYLHECLDSVLAQTMRDFEVICVDDGSTDSSLAILNGYAKKDARIKVIACEHSNAGHCRNVGYEASCGAFILFLDSDDVFSPSMFAILLNALVRTGADVCTCEQATYLDGEALPVLFADEKMRLREKHYSCRQGGVDIFSCWNGRAWDKLFRRSLIERTGIRFQEQRSSNDLLFTYFALTEATEIVRLPCSLIAHRSNAHSLEATRSKGALCIFNALDAYWNMVAERGIDKQILSLRRHFQRFVFNILNWYVDTIDTDEAYVLTYAAFREFAVKYQLADLIPELAADKLRINRLESLLNGASAIAFLRNQLPLFEQKLARAQDVKAYTVGRSVLAFPRYLRQVMRNVRVRFDI